MAKYIGGYKYQLFENAYFQTEIKPEKYLELPFSSLSKDGILTCCRGYAWDGATMAIDTKNFMRASLCHDALYQLMAHNLLDKKWREQADKELIKVAKANGMSAFRRWYVYLAIRTFGGNHLMQEKIREA